MNEPEWLTLDDIIDAHDRQLVIFGGAAGIRDSGSLESAINRPANKWRYEQTELPELAAAYAFGIVRNHPFVDGNKRAGFMAMVGFLRLNGIRFEPASSDAIATVLALAAGDLDEDGLARWIRDNIRS